MKVPLRRAHLADSIRHSRKDRPGFTDLAALLAWLWPFTAVNERYCRQVCMWLLDKLATLQMADAMQTGQWFKPQAQKTIAASAVLGTRRKADVNCCMAAATDSSGRMTQAGQPADSGSNAHLSSSFDDLVLTQVLISFLCLHADESTSSAALWLEWHLEQNQLDRNQTLQQHLTVQVQLHNTAAEGPMSLTHLRLWIQVNIWRLSLMLSLASLLIGTNGSRLAVSGCCTLLSLCCYCPERITFCVLLVLQLKALCP